MTCEVSIGRAAACFVGLLLSLSGIWGISLVDWRRDVFVAVGAVFVCPRIDCITSAG